MTKALITDRALHPDLVKMLALTARGEGRTDGVDVRTRDGWKIVNAFWRYS